MQERELVLEIIIFIITFISVVLINKSKIKVKYKKKLVSFLGALNVISIFLIGTSPIDIVNFINQNYTNIGQIEDKIEIPEYDINITNIPDYEGKPYISLNGNIPSFEEKYKTNESFEHYSKLDELGRCQTAIANIGIDLMPTEKRESIGSVKPTGWHTIKYNNVDGKYLYNRSHLIGYQLTGENANKNNLITGTRYFNVEGMLPFENMVADYIKETKNHVLYRVTPIYEENNLLAKGVIIEAESIEDQGEGIKFNVFCYNVQPGIEINYEDGTSKLTK